MSDIIFLVKMGAILFFFSKMSEYPPPDYQLVAALHICSETNHVGKYWTYINKSENICNNPIIMQQDELLGQL